MDTTIRAILTELERVRENMLTLSDDIWLSIDHNNSEAVVRGSEFKVAYNEKMAEFDRLATELSVLVQQYTDVYINQTSSEEETDKNTRDNQRIIVELNKEEPHALNEDFRYKRPYGFVLQGKAFKDIFTWRRVYELVCHMLAKKAPERFAALPDEPDFLSNRGNCAFSHSPDNLRSAMQITDNVYAEINYSANYIRDNIQRLLRVFSIPESEIRIYLREDRDADDLAATIDN